MHEYAEQRININSENNGGKVEKMKEKRGKALKARRFFIPENIHL